MASDCDNRFTMADRSRWWREARFGMFIHWGVYAIPAWGEWVMFTSRVPVREYEKLAQGFNPRRYNPREWAKLAREAGMRYMVLTTKHHDGFCLFDSKHTHYTSVRTAARRDLVAEYVEACRAEGLGIGFYYSIKDWHHPNYPLAESDPLCLLEPGLRRPDPDKYFKYMMGQLTELLSNYGKIDLLWFDGRNPIFDGKAAAAHIRKIQPHILINNRLLSGDEDFTTPEQTIPEKPVVENGRPVIWESCGTLTGNAWGYNKFDKDFRSPKELLRMLVTCASSGGNLLLNVGPRPDGTLQPEAVSRLKVLGRWMKKNSESVYATEAGPVCHPPYGRMTQKGSRVYLHVFDRPATGPLALPALSGKLLGASVLGGPALKVVRNSVSLPASKRDDMATVIALDYAHPPACIPAGQKSRHAAKKVDYRVVERSPIEVNGRIAEECWRGVPALRISQETNYDSSVKRYPASSTQGHCAYTVRAMHAGSVLYFAVDVESPTRTIREHVPSGDCVRFLIAADVNAERQQWNHSAFEINVDASGRSWMPLEAAQPGNIFRHAARPTPNGYSVVLAVPFSMMRKRAGDANSAVRPGDVIRFNCAVVQPSPSYAQTQPVRAAKPRGEWWMGAPGECYAPGPRHVVFWKGEGVDNDPFLCVPIWGLLKLEASRSKR